MTPLYRTAARTLRRRSPPNPRKTTASCRYASDITSPAGKPPHPAPAIDPKDGAESFGTSFYLLLASFPLCYTLYHLTAASNSTSSGTSESQNPLTALIARYSDYKDRWQTRNALHTAAMEQAGADRNLFATTVRENHVELRFPERMDMASPIAVPAGHTANIDGLVDKYRTRAFEEEEEKMERLRNGDIPGQKPYSGP